jgi:hypothetical protein
MVARRGARTEVANAAIDSLKPGTLVRYTETTARWYLAVVRAATATSVTLDFFWDRSDTVALESVEPFEQFLANRSKVFSVERSKLCQIFFDDELLRLRKERLKLMQKTLLSHGCAWDPEDWDTPTTRIQIWADPSVVRGELSRGDRELMSLLPQWLAPQKMPPGSRDPLGLQAYAEILANRLLPGLTVTTTRIGYYGFLAWAIQVVNERAAPSLSRHETLNRLERVLALCEFTLHGAGKNECRVIGQRSKTKVLESAERDRFNVPEKILKNQNTAGALRLYSTSLVNLGFLADAAEEGVDGRLPWALTESGRRLAQEYAKRIPMGFIDFALGDKSLPRKTLQDWGKKLCLSAIGKYGRYCELFMEGFLIGNAEGADTRYATVKGLFRRKLLDGRYARRTRRRGQDAVFEDDVDQVAELEEDDDGLGNYDVLMAAYDEPPSAENAAFQDAAVYELVCIGLSAIFQHVIRRLEEVGRISVDTLRNELAQDRGYSHFWMRPGNQAARQVRVPEQVLEDIFTDDVKPAQVAVLGGELLLAVTRGAPFAARRSELASSPAVSLVIEHFGHTEASSLADGYRRLLEALVERHGVVSLGKNRARWCSLSGDQIEREDRQPMKVGIHALRFPQLYSLCRDLNLQKGDLSRVG